MEIKNITQLKKALRKKWDEGKVRGLLVPDVWTWNDFWDFVKFDAIIERKQIMKNKLVRKAHVEIDQENKQKALQAVLEPSYNKFANAFTKVAPLIVKAHQRMMDKKKRQLRKRERLFSDIDDLDVLLNIGNFAILKKDIEVPKVNDYDVEEDPLVKKVKIILASKMLQLKRLIKKHPFVAKYIDNSLDALNKFIKRGNYKQAIIFTNDLIARSEKIIADEEGKVAFLELTKAEDKARMNTIALMDKLSERLGIEDAQLLGKEYFSEQQDKKDQAEKRRVAAGTYVKKPKPGKVSKPKKTSQIGISKPEVDLEDKSLMYEVPMEKEVEEEPEENKLYSLEHAFRDLTETQKQELLRRILKRKLEKMKEVEN